ncbi:hypothetical protein V8B97DRAFT_1869845 [Scleroderma yunnanense]
MIERERFEIFERERLETLERPTPAELAKARQEREKRPYVSLGVYIWPRTPFPYYFPEYIPTPVIEEGDKPEEGKATDPSTGSPANAKTPTELRLTIIIPPAFLPPCRPPKFRLWGGGHPPPTPFLPQAAMSPLSRRRVYTDDSNVIECAVHAGLLTWSGVARAKQEERAVRVVLSLVPTLSSASGAVRAPAVNSVVGNHSSIIGINGTSAITNGHVNGTASVPHTRTSTPLPPVPLASTPLNESIQPGYVGGVWASRFIGGWGEAFYGEPSAGRGEQPGQMSSINEAEDDGRGCVSCGWGWGHDGSAFEVVSVQVTEVGFIIPILFLLSAPLLCYSADICACTIETCTCCAWSWTTSPGAATCRVCTATCRCTGPAFSTCVSIRGCDECAEASKARCRFRGTEEGGGSRVGRACGRGAKDGSENSLLWDY